MQELSFDTMLAVLQEMFTAPLFWGLVAAALLVTAAYFVVLIRDRAVSWRKFLLAQLSMPVGAVAAVAFLMFITSSSLSDLGGPIDLIVLLGVAAGARSAWLYWFTPPSRCSGRRARLACSDRGRRPRTRTSSPGHCAHLLWSSITSR